MSHIIQYIIVFFIAIVEAVGLTVLRTGWKWAIPFASLNYALFVVPLLSYALTFKGIGMVNFLWNIFTTITMFFIGIYVFREKVHPLQLLGVFISLLGIGIVFMAPDSGNSTY